MILSSGMQILGHTFFILERMELKQKREVKLVKFVSRKAFL